MKTNKSSMMTLLGIVVIASASLLFSCNKNNDSTLLNDQSSVGTLKDGDNHKHSLIFPQQSQVYGKSYEEWGESFFRWQVGFDCAHYPYYDQTGALQDQNQHGKVFFLAGAPLKPVPNTTNREVTVSKNVSLFIPLIYYYANTCAAAPSSDLVGDVTGFTNLMDQLSLTIDGDVVDVTDYKTITPVFTYKANADLANCTGDQCFDGQHHDVALGGYWVILKKLSPGTHIIRTTGGASSVFPLLKDVYWTIHVTNHEDNDD